MSGMTIAFFVVWLAIGIAFVGRWLIQPDVDGHTFGVLGLIILAIDTLVYMVIP